MDHRLGPSGFEGVRIWIWPACALQVQLLPLILESYTIQETLFDRDVPKKNTKKPVLRLVADLLCWFMETICFILCPIQIVAFSVFTCFVLHWFLWARFMVTNMLNLFQNWM